MNLRHVAAGLILALGLAAAQSQPQDIRAPEDVRALTEGGVRFALDLYQALDRDENLFFSPQSLSAALAMAYAGAAGETARQMAETLHLALPDARLHEAFGALDQALAGRTGDAEGFTLRIANALWGQTGLPFQASYLQRLELHYGAPLRDVDFAAAPEEARQGINLWVEEMTEGRIPELMPPGTVSAMTRLVLVNAVYVKAAWQQPFEVALTEARPFYLLDGSEVRVPTMQQTETLAYAALEGYQAVQLPYEAGLDMLLIVPDAGYFREVEARLDPELLEEARRALRPTHLQLLLPKFSYSSSFSLSDTLASLGMTDAFTPQADFSGMGPHDLFIQEVVHEAFVAVDEEGTEAAAATGISLRVTSMPAETITLAIDRPFIYLIRDAPTGALLFMGRVLDPR